MYFCNIGEALLLLFFSFFYSKMNLMLENNTKNKWSNRKNKNKIHPSG